MLLENFRPGTLERWGLGPDELDRANPDLVITRISAFGQTGPMSERPGFAAVAEAVGGLRELVGDPDRPPVRVGVSIGDSIAGIYAAFGTVMALFQREPCKVPLAQRVIDVALNEAVLSVMESLVPDHLAYGVTRERVGGRMEGIAPSNAYPCTDGASIIVAGNGDAIFRRYMRAIGRPTSPTIRTCRPTRADGGAARSSTTAIGQWTIRHSRDEALEAPRRGGRAQRTDLHRRRHLRRRTVRGAQHDPVLRRRHRRTASRRSGFPGIVPVIGGASLSDPQRRPRPRRAHPRGAVDGAGPQRLTGWEHCS